MLPRANRLTAKADFQKVLKNKSYLHGRYFFIAYLKNESLMPKIGIIVSNKVSKKATERNRIKRIVREVAHTYLTKISPFLIVVLSKPTAAQVESNVLALDIEKIFKKLS